MCSKNTHCLNNIAEADYRKDDEVFFSFADKEVATVRISFSGDRVCFKNSELIRYFLYTTSFI